MGEAGTGFLLTVGLAWACVGVVGYWVELWPDDSVDVVETLRERPLIRVGSAMSCCLEFSKFCPFSGGGKLEAPLLLGMLGEDRLTTDPERYLRDGLDSLSSVEAGALVVGMSSHSS